MINQTEIEETETLTYYEPDIDICSDCGEHAAFTKENGSDCCGAGSYNTDYDLGDD